MIVRDERPHDVLTVLSLCQIAAVRARIRARMRTRMPSSVRRHVVQGQAGLEGPVDRLDDLARLEQFLADARGLAVANRPQQDQLTFGEE